VATLEAPRAKNRPKLSAIAARRLADVDSRYYAAKRELDAIAAERKALIAKTLPKVPVGEWVTVGGWAIQIAMQPSGQRFSLAKYLERYKLTSRMAEFVTPGSESPRLTVKPSGE